MEEDYYQVLGVPRNATKAQLRKAYRKLAIRWHPDKNPDNKEEAQRRFQKISQAYDTLHDERSRAEYDNLGRRTASSSFSSRAGDNTSEHEPRYRRPHRNARDIFAEFFGGRDPFASMFSGFNENGEDDFFGSPFSHRMHGSSTGRASSSSERSRRSDVGSRRPGPSGFPGFGSFFDGGFDDFFGHESGGTSSFTSSSFSSSMGVGGGGDGRRVVRSVSTRTSTVTGPDGVRRTTTTKTVRHPDGRVETTSNETESIEDRRSNMRGQRQYLRDKSYRQGVRSCMASVCANVPWNPPMYPRGKLFGCPKNPAAVTRRGFERPVGYFH